MCVKVHNCWKRMPTEKVHFPPATQSAHIGLASFYLNSDRYVKGALQVKGPETYEVYVNNEKQTAPDGKVSLSLEPHRYEIVIKYLAESDKAGT